MPIRDFATTAPTWLKRVVLSALLLSAMILPAVTPAIGAEPDAGAELIGHVTDGHAWRPLPFAPALPLRNITIGSVSIPITAHVLMLWINAAFLCAVLTAAFRSSAPAPRGIRAALEPIVFFVRDALVYPTMGEALGRRWLPFMYTLFFFVLSANLLGLLPVFPTATANLSITAALAVMVFVSVVVQGMARNGFVGFFRNLVPPGIPRPIALFLFFIELAGLLIRNGVLAVRLFANMIAGHFVIFALLMLMVLVHPLTGFVSVPLAVFIDLLEILVAIIQAIVFTMLAAIYISMAATHH